MRKFIVGLVALVATAASVSACGSNDKSVSKAGSKAPVAQTPADLAQKAMVTSEPKAVVAGETGGGTSSEDPGKPARFTLVLGEGGGGFEFNTVTLSDEGKKKIDEMFTGGKVDVKGAHFEIEGYTDNVGSKVVNERMGLRRANAVRQYLCEKYEIPMDCISVVSFGLEKPIADNATEEGRAQNRRVVIKVVD